MMPDVEPIDGKLVDIPLDNLSIRYIPMAELERWWDGDPLMALPTSPHVEIMRIFLEHGFDWKRLKHTRYADERRFRARIGMKQWAESPYMKWHFKKRYDLLRSIKKHGFRPNMRKNRPVAILKEPFWNTRFGMKNPRVYGYEIHNGGGASSACYVLGHKTIKGMWYRDTAPGTNGCPDLEKKFKNARVH
jgi:hypothetical protein